jgi:hypothetical protein
MDESYQMSQAVFTWPEAVAVLENTENDSEDKISNMGWEAMCEECFQEWYMDQTEQVNHYTPEEEGVRWWRKKFK